MTDILSGIRVVELAAWTFVPAAGAVLADWAADVIKIEHPETGDPQRGLIGSGIVSGAGGANHFVEQPNRGNRSVAINTRTPDELKLLVTKDSRFIAFVALQADRFWADFCTRLGRTDVIDDDRYANAAVRFGNQTDCIVELRKTIGSEDLAHWERAFAGFEGVWDVMHTEHEVHRDEQVLINGYLPRATNTSGIEFALAASPIQFDETPLDLDRAPEHGEHTDALLAELGFKEEIIDFKISSVVQ